MHCCLCRSTDDVIWCNKCGHRFCAYHRGLLWGRVERTAAAVKQLILRLGPPPYCEH